MKELFLLPLLVSFAFANGQPQSIFISDLTALQYSHLKDIKGDFITEDKEGTAYYVCTKPLLGFTTMIIQRNGSGVPIVRAMSNEHAPLPPMFEKVVDQLSRINEIMGIVKKDSDTDAALKGQLRNLSKLRKIITFTKTGEKRSVVFYQNLEMDYFIDIVLED